MSIDRRYPWMVRIEHSPLGPWERSLALRIAGAVERRTGCSCAYNRNSGGLFFHYGSMDRPAFEFPFKPDPDDGAAPVNAADVDELVRIIQAGRMPARDKDRITARNGQFDRWRQEEARDGFLESRRSEARGYAEFIDRRRRGVAKQWSMTDA